MKDNGIIIYQSEDGATHLEVKLEEETLWLSQQQMAQLYQISKSTVSEHIKHIFEDGELDANSVVRNFRTTAADGKFYNVSFYNLDMILSLGYRVKSIIATHFRRWATERLKEYIVKGFVLNDERMKRLGGGAYWYELLNRIRDIRSSKKVLYRQVLDLYATAVDYDPRAEASLEFFKIVQNKLHFAVHGNTAAELIYLRADADKPMMGLTSFKGSHPLLSDAKIAKNYLDERELKKLNNLVSAYFDLAEVQAMEHRPMYMDDYVKELDKVLSITSKTQLAGAGKVSHAKAMQHAEDEYRKWEVKTLSPVERAYLDSIKVLSKNSKK